MMKTIAAFGLAAAATAAPVDEVRMQADFVEFMKTHKKEYASDEVFGRYNIFKNNVARINHHNSQKLGWTMAVNEFADLTQDEFKASYYGYKPRANNYLRSQNVDDLSNVQVQAGSLDWRTKGAVTPVKNQGQCGSCWSFSTTGSIEGIMAITNKKITSCSEEELVQCDMTDNGCGGGLMDNAFKWVIKNGGLDTEGDYPYTSGMGQRGMCQKQKEKKHACTISGFEDVPSKNEAALKKAATHQPVSVAIQANTQGFQLYKKGVFSGKCGDQLDHGVLVAGYGAGDGNGEGYWIVKNSWGETWGNQGYIYMTMGGGQNGEGQCGIAMQPSYPTKDSNSSTTTLEW